MIQQSEATLLILAIALAPILVWTYRSMDLPHKRWLGVALWSMGGAYTATIIEGLIAPGLLNIAEHALFALAGVSFAIASMGLLRTSLGEKGDTA